MAACHHIFLHGRKERLLTDRQRYIYLQVLAPLHVLRGLKHETEAIMAIAYQAMGSQRLDWISQALQVFKDRWPSPDSGKCVVQN